jgi:hypothetical protein
MRKASTRCVIVILLIVARLSVTQAQPAANQSNGDATAKSGSQPVAANCPNCLPMTATVTVEGNVSVEAGLMPDHLVRQVFGKSIANEYAVFLLTVTNHSASEALILQSVFIDYSQWSLAGCRPSLGLAPPHLDTFHSATTPCQFASAEQGSVRALLQHGQTWSWRNQLIRYLTAAGAIATGLTFTAGPHTNLPKYITAVTGTVIPALGVAIPDEFIDRLNLINDEGFRVNTVVAKQSSIIVVAFFPLDRFLTPTLKSWFQAYPAVFFSPDMMLQEPDLSPKIQERLKYILTDREYGHLARSQNGTPLLRVDCMRADCSAIDKSQTVPPASDNPTDPVTLAKQYADAAQQAATDAQQTLAKAYSLFQEAQQALGSANNALETDRALLTDVSKGAEEALTAAQSASASSLASVRAARGAAAHINDAKASAEDLSDVKQSVREAADDAKQAKEAADRAAGSFGDLRKALADSQHAQAPPYQPAPALTPDLTAAEAATLQDVLDRFSLSAVRIVVGGDMTVDVSSVPGTIQQVHFDNGDVALAVAGKITGEITGLYLTNASPQLNASEAKQWGIPDLTAVTSGSTDSLLNFSLNLARRFLLEPRFTSP